MRPLLRLLVSALVFTCSAASAYDLADYLRDYSRDLKPLEFTSGAHTMSTFGGLSNRLFKPAGMPPYAVVVLGHTCGGVTRPHIRERMRDFLDAGYAVMALDSFSPRNIPHCRNQNLIRGPGTVTDAYRALAHLNAMPEVDGQRIFFVGYSWGGVVATVLASPLSAKVNGATLRFRGTVSNYAGCAYPQAAPAPKLTYVSEDLDRPLLMLMAGRDKDFDAQECAQVMATMKGSGKPVGWHVYPDTHHAWDQVDQRGQETPRTPLGQANIYLHDPQATPDATRRALEFIASLR